MPGAPAIPRLPRNGSRLTPQIYAAHPHIFPQPRIPIGLALLRRSLATAAIDLSDGLSTDLTHLCHESAVGAEIFATELPIHPLAQQSGSTNALELALHGGEDYELLFTA
jgi:thiamine-monophosphate kinase